MPKKIMSKNHALSVDACLEIFQRAFPQYRVYKNFLGVGVIQKSAVTGIAFRIKQNQDQTILIYNPMAPSAGMRALTAGLIPLVILYLTVWKKIQKEVHEFIESAPEFQSSGLTDISGKS